MNVTFPAALREDYGVPLGRCEEVKKVPGGGNVSAVFRREWSKATVTLDCLGWTADIQMKPSIRRAESKETSTRQKTW